MTIASRSFEDVGIVTGLEMMKCCLFVEKKVVNDILNKFGIRVLDNGVFLARVQYTLLRGIQCVGLANLCKHIFLKYACATKNDYVPYIPY